MSVLPNFRDPPGNAASAVAIAAAAKPRVADDEDEDKKDKDKKDGKAASDKDEDGRDDGNDKPSEGNKDGKSAKEKDEGEEDDEKDEDEKAKAARARERIRIQTILSSKVGQRNPDMAHYCAFSENRSSKNSIAYMQMMENQFRSRAPAAPAPQPSRAIVDRMEKVDIPAVGTDAAPGSMSLADQIVMAGKKRRGEV